MGELVLAIGGQHQIIVAYAKDGALLSSDGFARIINPGDKSGARNVSNLTRIQVIDPPYRSSRPIPIKMTHFYGGYISLSCRQPQEREATIRTAFAALDIEHCGKIVRFRLKRGVMRTHRKIDRVEAYGSERSERPRNRMRPPLQGLCIRRQDDWMSAPFG